MEIKLKIKFADTNFILSLDEIKELYEALSGFFHIKNTFTVIPVSWPAKPGGLYSSNNLTIDAIKEQI